MNTEESSVQRTEPLPMKEHETMVESEVLSRLNEDFHESLSSSQNWDSYAFQDMAPSHGDEEVGPAASVGEPDTAPGLDDGFKDIEQSTSDQPDVASLLSNAIASGPTESAPEIFDDLSDDIFQDVDGRGSDTEQDADQSEEAGSSVGNQVASLGLGAALVYAGFKGVAGLTGVFSKGGEAVSRAVSDYRLNSNETALRSTVDSAQEMMQELRVGGLADLDKPRLSEAKRQKLIEQFSADPDNKAKLDRLVSQIDKMGELSKKVARSGISSGMDGDTAAEHALAPLQRFQDANKGMLDSLSAGGQTLKERIDTMIGSVFDTIKLMLERLAQLLGMGGAASQGATAQVKGAPAPRVG